MNSNISKLTAIASKSSRLIIGLMSGTSLDGLDIALCRFEGSGPTTKATILQFETVPYTDEFKEELKSIAFKKNIDLEKLCLLNSYIAKQHAVAINGLLQKWDIDPSTVDLIASHGQTVYHAPARSHQHSTYGNATLQIGDADHLAVITGIITISDFRQKHIAAGGEGAPLAVYGDQLLFSKEGEDRVLLNIGGIANFTFLPGKSKDENIICTDCGPGNTLMDAFMQERFPWKYYDENATIALSGNINDALLSALKENDFFEQAFPKTTGPELFDMQYLSAAKQKSQTNDLTFSDTMATLNKFSADSIVASIKTCIKDISTLTILCSGGGIHNPLLMQHIGSQLPGCTFESTALSGINPDAKEAFLFAILANECICGNNEGKGVMPAISMGKISFPI